MGSSKSTMLHSTGNTGNRSIPPIQGEASRDHQGSPNARTGLPTPAKLKDRIDKLIVRIEQHRALIVHNVHLLFAHAENASLAGVVRILQHQLDAIPNETVLLGALANYLDEIEHALETLQGNDPDERIIQLGRWIYSSLRQRSALDQRITRMCSFLRTMREDAELLTIVLDDAGDDVISEWIADR